MKVDKTWRVIDEHYAALIRLGGDPEKIEDRVAFIEKTPRIRIRPMDRSKCWTDDWINWAARPWKGDYGADPESRAWCEQALVLFGHDLVDA